jgi:cytochrome c553
MLKKTMDSARDDRHSACQDHDAVADLGSKRRLSGECWAVGPVWRAANSGRAMVNIRRFAVLAVSLMGASAPILADDQKPANAQERYLPRLNDMMVTTQLRHFKLWYAGTVQNWQLANYELAQIRGSIEDIKNLYPINNSTTMRTMTAQVTDELDSAIAAKDSIKFSNAFEKLTSACNSCHETAGVGFIKIREPRLSPLETSPLSNETFLK